MARPPDEQKDLRSSIDGNVRALARGAGYIFQGVGLILLLGGCCLSPLIGYFQGEQDAVPRTPAEWFRQPAGQVLTALTLVILAPAGLGLLVFGLGLHQERRGSGTGAMITTGILALGLWATVIGAIVAAPSILRIALFLLLATGATLLFLLAGAARRELKLNPPPPDEPVTEAFLKQFERRRHRMEEDESAADHGSSQSKV